MSYAIPTDMTDRFGLQAMLVVADRDNDAVVDAPLVTAALDAASDEIDGYLRVAYDLPIPTVPPTVREICCDLAMYRLSIGADLMSEDKQTRRNDAIKTLKSIASGDFDLGFSSPQNGGIRGAVVVAGPERRWGRDRAGAL